jgi:hypothetical protein
MTANPVAFAMSMKAGSFQRQTFMNYTIPDGYRWLGFQPIRRYKEPLAQMTFAIHSLKQGFIHGWREIFPP